MLMTTLQSQTYELDRASNCCVATGQPLVPGQQMVTVLIDDGQTLRRADYSMHAWQHGSRPPHVFGLWISTVPEPNTKPRMFVDDEVLMNLLRRLEDADQPDRLAFRFVLMLILMRKKLLRYDKTEKRPNEQPAEGEPAEQEWWLLTPKLDLSKGPLGKWNDEEAIAVLDPQLGEEQIRQVTDQLGQILHAEL
jgi:hypothetical protein